MALKAGVCDSIAQLLYDPSTELDIARTAKFTLFCVGYVGSFQHVLFNEIYPRIFQGSGRKIAMKISLMDNFIHSPFLYLPTYYAFRSVSDGGSITEGLRDYYHEGLETLLSCWGLWVPAQFFNFWLIPKNMRILFIAVVGSLWEVVLSVSAPMKSTVVAGYEGSHDRMPPTPLQRTRSTRSITRSKPDA